MLVRQAKRAQGQSCLWPFGANRSNWTFSSWPISCLSSQFWQNSFVCLDSILQSWQKARSQNRLRARRLLCGRQYLKKLNSPVMHELNSHIVWTCLETTLCVTDAAPRNKGDQEVKALHKQETSTAAVMCAGNLQRRRQQGCHTLSIHSMLCLSRSTGILGPF